MLGKDLFARYARNNSNQIDFENLDQIKVWLFSSLGSVVMLVQVIIGISLIVKRGRYALNDKNAGVEFKRKNKYEYKEKEIIAKDEPIIRSSVNKEIEWMEKDDQL